MGGYTWCMIYTFTISPAFSDFAGRKITIIVGGLLYGVGGILQSGAFFLWLVHAVHILYSRKLFVDCLLLPHQRMSCPQISQRKHCHKTIKFAKVFCLESFHYIYIWWCNHAYVWHYFLSLFPYIGWCLWEDLLVVWVLGKYVVARLFTVWDIMITHWMSVVSSSLWCLYTLLRSLQRSWEDASYLSIPLDWPQDYWYIQLFFFFHATNMKNFHWNLQFSIKLNCWQKNWNACISSYLLSTGGIGG